MSAERKLPIFSASQVATYEACPRKWAFQKIDGLESPAGAAAAFGSQVHSHLEAWFERRELPPETETGKVARAMIPHLPAPQKILAENVEKEFSWRFGDDIAFRGFIDLVDESVVPLTIYDHKTTGSLAYAKSVTDLLDDPQATLYARAMMDARGLDRVRLRWTYATRKGRTEVRPVEVEVTRQDIDARVKATLRSAREMHRYHDECASAAEVPANPNACHDYGGCPFGSRCEPQTQGPRTDHMSDKNSFLQRLQARKAGATAAPAPAAAPAPLGYAVNPPEAEEIPEAAKTLPHAAPVEAAAVKRGPGRPRKTTAETASAHAEPPDVALAPEVAVQANVARAIEHAPVATAGGVAWTLYLDCAPTKGPRAEHLADRLARVMLAYTAETGQSHYRLAEYGKGPALFAEGFARDLDEHPPVGGIVVSTASQEARDVLQLLQARAAVIVQG